MFLETDVEFINDGRTEEIMNNREKYSNQIKYIFTEHGYSYKTISGDYYNRFTKAVEIINKLLYN